MFKRFRDRFRFKEPETAKVKPGWHMPEEKLPPVGVDVLVATMPGYMDVAEFRGGDNAADWWAHNERIPRVYAWRKLPDGPFNWSGGTHKGSFIAYHPKEPS